MLWNNVAVLGACLGKKGVASSAELGIVVGKRKSFNPPAPQIQAKISLLRPLISSLVGLCVFSRFLIIVEMQCHEQLLDRNRDYKSFKYITPTWHLGQIHSLAFIQLLKSHYAWSVIALHSPKWNLMQEDLSFPFQTPISMPQLPWCCWTLPLNKAF